ncbi:bifunctional riboflavin kinase/FAD synthetase [Candidatus Endowatersipora endosymbiont of Watersipora subatra]|uniref:bifunctional riboflavin kinase/FAD synthetase n=1 Tax=Candidatus Endowatersipora endosymbiont of Watersipora subatra TaxID=3077946 RepID=UPI00312CBF71
MTISHFLHCRLGDHCSIVPRPRESVVAIGNFDGVHCGHQSVLQMASGIARSKGLDCYVLSFEPHPQTLFKPHSPVFRLTPEIIKAKVIKAFGLDGLLILPFTWELADTSADTFIKHYILKQAGAKHVVTGFNFHFGKNRQGSPEYLSSKGRGLGFSTTTVEEKDDEQGELVSSRRIRKLLEASDIKSANQLLGYRWIINGFVQAGQRIGRTLGYPTANLSLPSTCHLAYGIYAVRLRRENGQLYDGVASYGRRPTIGHGEVLLEIFIFDFSGDLYGEELSISLFDHIRREKKFKNIRDLIKRMDQDSITARKILRGARPFSRLDKIMNFSM